MTTRRVALSLALAAAALTAAGAGPAAKGGWLSDPQGCRVWREGMSASLSVRWSGGCERGLANGVGVLEWSADGRLESRYEGEMRLGHYHGKGSYIWPSGDRYWGEISGGRRQGHGFFAWANGDRYDGEWRDGRREGFGTYLWASGARYEGSWKDDRAEGEGSYREADGTVFKGRFMRGCLREGDRRVWVGTESAACK